MLDVDKGSVHTTKGCLGAVLARALARQFKLGFSVFCSRPGYHFLGRQKEIDQQHTTSHFHSTNIYYPPSQLSQILSPLSNPSQSAMPVW